MGHLTRISTSISSQAGLLAALALVLLLAPASVRADKTVAGWVEYVTLLPSAHLVKAKLDTGANTSSINAHDIENFRRDGKRWVRFTLKYEDRNDIHHQIQLERRVVRRIKVKEHEGEHNSRPVVSLPLCFNGQPTEAQFSLVDRSRFIYPVLLGRRFLKHHAIVDPASTFRIRKACSSTNSPLEAEEQS